MKKAINLILQMKSFCILLALLSSLIISSLLFYLYIELETVSVFINNNGVKSEFLTMEETLGDLLEKHQIAFRDEDFISPDETTILDEDLFVTIRRSFKVTINADNKELYVYVINGTVKDVLKVAGVELSVLDEVTPALYSTVYPGLVVEITRIRHETYIHKETIPYQIVVKNDNTREEKYRKIIQDGIEGELQKEYKVVYRDGVEISRELFSEKIIRPATDHIIKAGTLQNRLTSRGEVFRYVHSRLFEVTAYTHTGNPTRTGVMPQIGHIAVDPRVIPLNSTVYIDFSGRWNHLDGFYKATDTGSAIIGNIIDIFMDTEEIAIQFGRRRARVYMVR